MNFPSETCGQFLVIGIPGPELDRDMEDLIQAVSPGGFILFSRNLETPEQTARLVARLHWLSAQRPFIMIDEEGGRVSRLRKLGVRSAGAKRLSLAGDPGLVERQAAITASLLRLLGIQMNLAPVLDLSLSSNADDGTLRSRCWGRTPEQVLHFADVYRHSMRRGGVLTCAKHFPSYTGAACDPHEGLPSLRGRLADKLEGDLLPWMNLLPEVDAVMTAHVLLPDEDPPVLEPASLASSVVTSFLRLQLGFEGLVLSDDLEMGAIRNRYSPADAAAACIAAGSDLALLCHDPGLVHEACRLLAEVPRPQRDDAERRLRSLRRKLREPEPFSLEKWRVLADQASVLDDLVPGTDELSDAANGPGFVEQI